MRAKHLPVPALVATLVVSIVVATLAGGAAAAAAATNGAGTVAPLTPGQTPDLVTVAIDGRRAGPSSAGILARSVGGRLVKVSAAGTDAPVAVVRVAKGRSQRAAAALYRENAVLWAEPDTRLHADAEPNDPCYQRT